MDILKLFGILETIGTGLHAVAAQLGSTGGAPATPGTAPEAAPAPTGAKRGRPAKTAEAPSASTPAVTTEDLGNAIKAALEADKAKHGPAIKALLTEVCGGADKAKVQNVPADKLADTVEKVKAMLGLGGGEDDFGV